jgi:hypothetical protein
MISYQTAIPKNNKKIIANFFKIVYIKNPDGKFRYIEGYSDEKVAKQIGGDVTRKNIAELRIRQDQKNKKERA